MPESATRFTIAYKHDSDTNPTRYESEDTFTFTRERAVRLHKEHRHVTWYVYPVINGSWVGRKPMFEAAPIASAARDAVERAR